MTGDVTAHAPAMLRVLTFTTLYPNSAQPRLGVFVEERVRHLQASGRVDVAVIAPIPWFPFASSAFGSYAEFARAPKHEHRHGLDIDHPRYPVIPKVGMSLAPLLLALAVLRRVLRLCREREIQVIDSHFLYPDGVAACMLGAFARVPVLMTARGSDVNVFPRSRIPRALIRWAARRCFRLVTVSESLRDSLIGLGVDPARIVTLRNGVDLERFRPLDRDEARRTTGMSGPTLLSVGNLFELKGHHLVIQALRKLPGVSLAVLGDGPMRRKLEALAAESGVADRVRLMGNVPQAELPAWYSAADALVLASSREGMPNVILESLACGTPVIGTAVGGIPELLTTPDAGSVIDDRSPDAIAAAVTSLLAAPPPRDRVRAHASRFGWAPTVEGLLELMTRAAGSTATARTAETHHA